jgi:hypothetical protein
MWSKRFCLLLSFCFLALSWAPAQSTSPSVDPPTASALPSSQSTIAIAQSLSTDSSTLVARLAERKTQAEAQVQLWQTTVTALKSENEKDKQSSSKSLAKLVEAEARLAESRTALAEISSLLAQSQSDAAGLRTDFDAYKGQAEAKIRSGSLSAALWRAGALAAVGGCAGLTADRSTPTGALYGAGAGLAAGAVWWLVENWPWKILRP